MQVKTKFEIIEICKTQLIVDVSLLTRNELYFNATEIANFFDKQPSDYLRLNYTKEYMEALISRYGISPNDLIKIKQGGKYQGSWFHKFMAVDYARWCNPTFAVELDAWIFEKLEEEKQRKLNRLAAKTGYLPLTLAIQQAHIEPQFYHYSNEADLINKIVLGCKAKQYCKIHNIENVRDNCSILELEIIDKLQKANTTLIELGLSYEDRKDKLQILYNKYNLTML